MRNGLIEWLKVVERRRGLVVRRRGEMLVEPFVARFPGLRSLLAESAGEIFAQQRMRVERKERACVAVDGHELGAGEAGQHNVAPRLAEGDQRLGQAVDRRRAPERRETAGVGRAVEQAEKPQHRERPLAVLLVAFEPFHIGVDGAEGVAALLLGVRLRQPDPVALMDVAVIRVAQKAADDGERQRVALDVLG